VKSRQLIGIKQLNGLRVTLVQRANLAPRAADFGAGAFQHFLVVRILPLHQVFDDLKKSLALLCHSVFPGTGAAITGYNFGRVIDHLCKNHSPRCCQRTPCPPKVQRAWVAVADGLFARRCNIDGVERQGDFDEFFRGFDAWHWVITLAGRMPALLFYL